MSGWPDCDGCGDPLSQTMYSMPTGEYEVSKLSGSPFVTLPVVRLLCEVCWRMESNLPVLKKRPMKTSIEGKP